MLHSLPNGALAVAGCCENMPKKIPKRLPMTFSVMQMFLPFHVTCESRLSRAGNVNILPVQGALGLVLVTVYFLQPLFI